MGPLSIRDQKTNTSPVWLALGHVSLCGSSFTLGERKGVSGGDWSSLGHLFELVPPKKDYRYWLLNPVCCSGFTQKFKAPWIIGYKWRLIQLGDSAPNFLSCLVISRLEGMSNGIKVIWFTWGRSGSESPRSKCFVWNVCWWGELVIQLHFVRLNSVVW